MWGHFQKAVKPKVPDYIPYIFTKKGGPDYVDCITKVEDMVAKAVTDVKKTSDNKWLFDRLNERTQLIRQPGWAIMGALLLRQPKRNFLTISLRRRKLLILAKSDRPYKKNRRQ